jgi:hypothetical protein
MADPSNNAQVLRRGDDQGIRSCAMDGGVQTLYIGQLVMYDATGYLVKAADTAACRFAGISNDKKAQASSVTDGTNEIKVQTKGECVGTFAAVAVTDVGKPVWISDSATMQLTPGEVFVGWVSEHISSTTAWVELAGDFQPRRFDILLSIGTSAASDTIYSAPWVATRACKILGARVNAIVYPDYATSVVDVDKYDIGTTADKEVVAATDIDNKTDKTSIALTLTTTAADLLLAVGDSLYASQTLGATEVNASEGLGVTVELEEYGRPNA